MKMKPTYRARSMFTIVVPSECHSPFLICLSFGNTCRLKGLCCLLVAWHRHLGLRLKQAGQRWDKLSPALIRPQIRPTVHHAHHWFWFLMSSCFRAITLQLIFKLQFWNWCFVVEVIGIGENVIRIFNYIIFLTQIIPYK